jgi:hypothetical protein
MPNTAKSDIVRKYIRRRITYEEAFDALTKDDWTKSDAEMYLRGVDDVISFDKKLVILMVTEWEFICKVLTKCSERATFEECPDKGLLHELIGKLQQQLTE